MIDLLPVLLERVLPVATFLIAITAVAELSDRAGVFDIAAHALARWGRGSAWGLWLLFSAFAVSCTIFLSLDTTAVLLTPVAIALAAQIGAAPRPFAMTTLWIANTGSLLLPVSNLTNLLALDRFDHLGVDHGGFVCLAAAPAAAAVVTTLLLVAWLFRHDLSHRYTVDAAPATHDPVLAIASGAVCLVIGPAFALGGEPWLVALLALTVSAAVTAWRDASLLRGLDLPWVMAAGFAVLTLAVTGAHRAGVFEGAMALAAGGSGMADLGRLAGMTALSANLVDNLPAYLVMEPAGTDPARLMAVLIGANAGPLVTPWASLATLLWLQRCRAGGVRWNPWRLAGLGLLCATCTVVAAVTALALSV